MENKIGYISLCVGRPPVIHKAKVIFSVLAHVVEAKRNCKVRLWEHCSTKTMCETGNHLLLNLGPPKHVNKQKILDAIYIRALQPTLDNHLNTKRALL